MVDDENNLPEVRQAMQEGLRVGLRDLHTDTVKQVIVNMSDGKDAMGNDWEPIKPETIEQSAKTVPLVDTGDLRRDIGATSEVDLDQLIGVITTSKAYGKYHELGAPEAGLPRRPFLAPAAQFARQEADSTIGGAIDVRLEGTNI